MSSSDLLATPLHRVDCVFGSGFFRLTLRDGGIRYCQTTDEVEFVHSLLATNQVVRVERDGHCLDGDRWGDANTPDVIDGEQWLAMPREQAMMELGMTDEKVYSRVYNQIEAAVSRRNDRASQGGVRASIVIKRPGVKVQDVS